MLCPIFAHRNMIRLITVSAIDSAFGVYNKTYLKMLLQRKEEMLFFIPLIVSEGRVHNGIVCPVYS